MQGNLHVRFLGELTVVILSAYPTQAAEVLRAVPGGPGEGGRLEVPVGAAARAVPGVPHTGLEKTLYRAIAFGYFKTELKPLDTS